MKYIFLACALLIPHTLIITKEYPLSAHSKGAITFKSILGGMVGAFAGAFGYALTHTPDSIYMSRSGFGFDLPQDQWCYDTIAATAVLGAAITAYYSYISSPEKQFEKAEKIVKDFEEAVHMQKALETEDICDLESWYQLKIDQELLNDHEAMAILRKINIDPRFPTRSAYYHLQGQITSLQKAHSIFSSMESTAHKDLVNRAHEYALRIEVYIKRLQAQFERLKVNPQLIKEMEEYDEMARNAYRQYPMHPNPMHQPVLHAPAVVVPTVVIPMPAPTPQVTIPAPVITPTVTTPNISPVLNGNVYGTIWANY